MSHDAQVPDPDEESTLTPRQRFLIQVGPLILLVCLGIAAAFYLFATMPSGSGPTDAQVAAANLAEVPDGMVVVIEQIGTGQDVTTFFEVAGSWRVQWSTTGQSLRLSLTGDVPETHFLEVTEGPAAGTEAPGVDGAFRLHALSDEAWAVRVIQPGG